MSSASSSSSLLSFTSSSGVSNLSSVGANEWYDSETEDEDVHYTDLCKSSTNCHEFEKSEEILSPSLKYHEGHRYFSPHGYAEYLPGSLPVIIFVPHGGRRKPKNVPKRQSGCHEEDWYTQSTARRLRAAIFRETKQAFEQNQSSTSSHAKGDSSSKSFGSLVSRFGYGYPHMVICHLHRSCLDANRPLDKATEYIPQCVQAWKDLHAFVAVARLAVHNFNDRIVRLMTTNYSTSSSLASISPVPSAMTTPQRGLFLDFHGQSFDERHQLGYMTTHEHLLQTNSFLDDSSHFTASRLSRTSLRCLPLQSPSFPSFSSLIRGNYSFGFALENEGFLSVPSPTQYHTEKKEKYFHGGFNALMYGTSDETIQLIQQLREKKIKNLLDEKDDEWPYLIKNMPEKCEELFAAFQLEGAFKGARDTKENQEKFAAGTARAILQYLIWHF